MQKIKDLMPYLIGAIVIVLISWASIAALGLVAYIISHLLIP